MCLKKSDPDAYTRLLNLEGHTTEPNSNDQFDFDDCIDVAQFIKRFFKTNDFTENEITKIASILKVCFSHDKIIYYIE